MGKVIKVKNKTLYETNIVPNFDLISAYIRDGLSDADICKRIDVSPATFYKCRREHPEFEELFLKTRAQVDLVEVVGSYFRQAIGYTVVEHSKKYKWVDGEKRLVWETESEKYIPPSEKATANWIALRLKSDPVWGELAKVLYKQSDGQRDEEAGVILMPPRRDASNERTIDVVVSEECDGEDTMDTTGETDRVHVS